MPQDSKIVEIQAKIDSAEAELKLAKQMLFELTGKTAVANKADYSKQAAELNSDNLGYEDSRIIEGIFNGETMTDKEGKEFPVPANYASKSKLIPGDVLKLTIKEDGSFLYKQIGPIDRKRILGTLTYEDGQYKVIAEGKAYKVLLASITYFKAEIGDQITLIIPTVEDSEWGSIENVIPQSENDLEIE